MSKLRRDRAVAKLAIIFLVLFISVLASSSLASYIEEDQGRVAPPPPPADIRPSRPPDVWPPSRHVPELTGYLDRLEVGEPVVYHRLAVYPVTLRGGEPLGGRWLTMDEAIRKGVLEIWEKGSGSVPVIVMENRSRWDSVFIMAGEIASGGKQTRTVRQDIILTPGQRIDVAVYCVEQRRWEGSERLRDSGALLPQSIQKELRRGASQDRIWSEIARSNAALGAEPESGSLELSLKDPGVRRSLDEARGAIVPHLPRRAVGYILVHRGQAVGAEFFGRSDMARALLPKIIDAYAADCVLQDPWREERYWDPNRAAAAAFLERIRWAGSYYAGTPGSGAGIRTRSGGVLGDGVGLGGQLVHYGCQWDGYVPVPEPPVPLPWRMER